jgi:alkylation response protein AidB-like acyl-CoA dehydrogenase
MYAQISSLETYLYSITENSLDAMSLRDIFSAKILATDYATEISNETVQIFAGYGYIKDDGIDRFMRDSKVLQVFPESNEVLHMQIANELKSIHSKK